MAFVINSKCVNCDVCIAQCPAYAIAKTDGTTRIDATACVDCGTCEAVCPKLAVDKVE